MHTYERIEGLPISSMPDQTYIILWFSIPVALVIAVFARQRLHAAISAVLFLGAFSFITLMQLQLDFISAPGLFVFVSLIAWFSPLILLSVAPARAVSRRLIFLALGLLLLIALNELSKFIHDFSSTLQG